MQTVSLAAGHDHTCLDPLAEAGQYGASASAPAEQTHVYLQTSIFALVLVGTTIGGACIGVCVGLRLGMRQRSPTRQSRRRATMLQMPTMPWRVSRGYKLQELEPVAPSHSLRCSVVPVALRDADVLVQGP